MATWETTTRIALISLLSGLIVAVVAVFLNLHFTGKSLYEVLLSRKKVILSILLILVLLILLMPVFLSLPTGTWLSPIVLAVYLRELLVSVVIVVSFGVTWKVLNDLRTYVQINRIQIVSLSKVRKGDSTGSYELWEDVKFGKGLRFIAYLLGKMVLWWGESGEYKKELQLLLSHQRA